IKRRHDGTKFDRLPTVKFKGYPVLPTASRLEELEQNNAHLTAQLATLTEDCAVLKQQLDWFKRQLFGNTSEKRLDVDPAVQGNLLEELGAKAPPQKESPKETITYQRRKKARDGAVNDTGLRFSDDVPREIIAVTDPEIEAIPADRRELIGEKVTCRLAQRPGSYVVIEYTRPVYKLLDDESIVTTPAPANVLDKSVADVSLLAGMLIDKFCYHLPLHRQHQRLSHCGIQVSRSSLTNWVSRAIDLLNPIVDAQSVHLLQSRVLAMDETPIKAGRQKKGKLRQGYFWPIYGEDDEIVFHYAPSREHRHVQDFLGDFSGTLLSDGYEAYAAYAKQNAQVTHAQCWAHCRRGFEQAQESEPGASADALALVGALYRHEQIMRDQQLEGEKKLDYRTQHSEPIVNAFWNWCDGQCHRADLLPRSPLAKALKYAMVRQASLQVFLSDPEVPIDTNHLERGLRVIPTGKKNWLFCWTEIGAKRVAVIQSLLVTCRLQSVDPYTYLVDVLQRMSEHPASRVIELTPREWKTKFADNPMKSDLALAQQ
ncbi:MAG: IS66 family transposase, partial [Desulfobacterales bacterium]|nr:IS66 family transposase [Desulfobacterales bacterium]